MKIHIIFKGSLRGTWPLFKENYMAMIHEPLSLQTQGAQIKVSAFLWEDEDNKEFSKQFKNVDVYEYPLEKMGKGKYETLKGMFDDVLDFCHKNEDDTDYYIILRPDLLYKSPIDVFLDLPTPVPVVRRRKQIDESAYQAEKKKLRIDFDILLPHKEYEIHWITHRRVGDSFYVFKSDASVLKRIKLALNDIDLIRQSTSLYQTDEDYIKQHLTHHWYDSLVNQQLNIDFLLPGCYDSNTYHVATSHLGRKIRSVSKNPFYITGDKNINVHGIFYPHDDVDIDGLIRGEKKLNYENIETIYR